MSYYVKGDWYDSVPDLTGTCDACEIGCGDGCLNYVDWTYCEGVIWVKLMYQEETKDGKEK